GRRGHRPPVRRRPRPAGVRRDAGRRHARRRDRRGRAGRRGALLEPGGRRGRRPFRRCRAGPAAAGTAAGRRAGHRAPAAGRPAVGDGSGLAAPVPRPFDLTEAVRSAVTELPTDSRRRVRVDLPDVVPKALGERASLATVLAELITNAIKYSPPDARVEVSGV